MWVCTQYNSKKIAVARSRLSKHFRDYYLGLNYWNREKILERTPEGMKKLYHLSLQRLALGMDGYPTPTEKPKNPILQKLLFCDKIMGHCLNWMGIAISDIEFFDCYGMFGSNKSNNDATIFNALMDGSFLEESKENEEHIFYHKQWMLDLYTLLEECDIVILDRGYLRVIVLVCQCVDMYVY